MKTQFDKIYVLSLITNKDRQEFIKYQFNELGLDFEFIYGLDFFNLKHDKFGNIINYPNMLEDNENHIFNNDKAYGCAMTHYRAIMQAYYLGYNNVLIIEDDICFVKNKEKLIEYYLNNIPDDADFITFTARFNSENEIKSFKTKLKNSNDKFIKIENNYYSLCGGMMYGLMNRNTIQLYLESKRKSLQRNDHTMGIFINPQINRYTSKDAICIDQFNIFLQNQYVHYSYIINNLYNKSDDFFRPVTHDDLSNIKFNINA